MENKTTEKSNKSYTVQCIQYILSQHMKNKNIIKKDELMKTVFKGHPIGKHYERIMEDVGNSLNNVFGFSISYIKDDCKKFIIVNNIKEIDIPGTKSNESSRYRTLLKPIIAALVMLRMPISESQMWNIMERFSLEFDLEMNLIKKMVKVDFVKDNYLLYKPTDESTFALDPEKTSYWFSLGPRAIEETDKMALLLRMGELYKKPVDSFKRVFATLNK